MNTLRTNSKLKSDGFMCFGHKKYSLCISLWIIIYKTTTPRRSEVRNHYFSMCALPWRTRSTFERAYLCLVVVAAIGRCRKKEEWKKAREKERKKEMREEKKRPTKNDRTTRQTLTVWQNIVLAAVQQDTRRYYFSKECEWSLSFFL